MPLRFVFSSAIDPSSVSETAVSVTTQAGVPLHGRVVVEGRTVTYHPTVLPGDRNDYEPPNHPLPNGFGFAPGTKYRVKLLGNHPFALRNRSGNPLAASVSLSFTTGLDFVEEDPPDFPTLAQPLDVRFDPDPIVEGDPLDPDPARQPRVTPRLETVGVTFGEPMDVRTFDPLSTFTVRNITETPEPIPGLGDPIPGIVEWSPDGRTFFLRFLFTLGDNPGTEEPFEFELTLTDELADLAGHPLSLDANGAPLEEGKLQLRFTTADLPGEPSYRLILETFDTRDNIDTIYDETTARWDGDGLLEGGEVLSRFKEFDVVGNNFLLPDPLRSEGSRFQMIFYRTNTGEPEDGEVLTGMSWSPRSSYLFASTYRDLRFAVGHFTGGTNTGLGRTYSLNYIGEPITMFEGDYEVPSSLATEWYPWPEWSSYFPYDPSNSLVFEVDCPPGGDTYQLFRNQSAASLPRRRNIGPAGAADATNRDENTQYRTRFEFARITTVAYSRFFDTGVARPNYLDPVIELEPDRPGTSVAVQWQGAMDDGNGQPTEPFSVFVDDIELLEIFQHLRFRVLLTADPLNQILPAVRSVAVAYEFR
jgi:hypothetical protein